MKTGRVSPGGEEPGATQQSKRSAVRNRPSVSSPFLGRELTKAESRGKQSSVGKRGPEPQVGAGERWLPVEATIPWLGQVLVSAGVEWGGGFTFRGKALKSAQTLCSLGDHAADNTQGLQTKWKKQIYVLGARR